MLLHDAVEDAPPGTGGAVLADIRSRFGHAVADIVRACSDGLDEDGNRSGTWAERKRPYVVGLADKPLDALLVTAGDKTHNGLCFAADVRRYGQGFWSTFDASRGELLWYYASVKRAVAERLPGSSATDALHRAVGELARRSGHPAITSPAGDAVRATPPGLAATHSGDWPTADAPGPLFLSQRCDHFDLPALTGGQVARSIGDWFADHARELPDDAPDDEVVERQTPWDLQATELSTTRSARRDAGLSGRTTWTPRSRAGGGRYAAAGIPARSGGTASAGGAASSVQKSVRKKILAAARVHPRADARSLAASLTRAGTPVSPPQVAAVLGGPLSTASTDGHATDAKPVTRRVASEIRRAAHANPQIGHKRLAALLRARGTHVTKVQVAQVLARRQPPDSAVRRSMKTPKPALVIKVTAGAQSSRTVHETPLCQSCGVRLSIYGTCRCS